MSHSFVVSPDRLAPPLKMVGEKVTVLAPASATGSYEIFRQAGPEGSGPPPHSHPWDEAFYVIDGQVVFGIDAEQDVTAEPGTLVHIPGGSTHWFRFGASGGVMLSITSRAGASAFFTQIDREVSPTNPDLGALVGIAIAHGLDVPIPAA